MANKLSFPSLGLTPFLPLPLAQLHSPCWDCFVGISHASTRASWQDVHSWGGFVFPLLKIFSLLKAEQVVMREFFYSSMASAGGYKQQEQEDWCRRMDLHSWQYWMSICLLLVEPLSTMTINPTCTLLSCLCCWDIPDLLFQGVCWCVLLIAWDCRLGLSLCTSCVFWITGSLLLNSVLLWLSRKPFVHPFHPAGTHRAFSVTLWPLSPL